MVSCDGVYSYIMVSQSMVSFTLRQWACNEGHAFDFITVPIEYNVDLNEPQQPKVRVWFFLRIKLTFAK